MKKLKKTKRLKYVQFPYIIFLRAYGIRRIRIPPPTPTLTPMKGPAKPLLGVIVSVSGNYVFSFLRNLDTDGHLLIAFNCNGKSFFVSGKWILEQFYYKCRKCASGLDSVNSKLIIRYKFRLFYFLQLPNIFPYCKV